MRTALYTTIYPGVEGFLGEWGRSVLQQDDKNFELVVGVDGVNGEALQRALPGWQRISWIAGEPSDTPASVRSRAFQKIVSEYDVVVFADCDDVLYPDRVSSGVALLEQSDVAACALRLIDASGRDLQIELSPCPAVSISETLPRHNMFGLSNTSWRTSALRSVLPIPRECVLVDWFMATAAYLSGARMGFTRRCHMEYRQHAANTARLLPPFSREDLASATSLVLGHYDLVFRHLLPQHTCHSAAFEAARQRARTFAARIVRDEARLDRYLAALNNLPAQRLWWTAVADSRLEHLWKSCN